MGDCGEGFCHGVRGDIDNGACVSNGEMGVVEVTIGPGLSIPGDCFLERDKVVIVDFMGGLLFGLEDG
jgi:hypothetical protein